MYYNNVLGVQRNSNIGMMIIKTIPSVWLMKLLHNRKVILGGLLRN
jgi:hypothetical protein